MATIYPLERACLSLVFHILFAINMTDKQNDKALLPVKNCATLSKFKNATICQ